MRDHGRPNPAGNAICLYRPPEHGARLASGQHRAEHEPAVLRLIAAIIECNLCVRRHDYAPGRVLRGKHKASRLRDRKRLGSVPVASPARRVALDGLSHRARWIKRKAARFPVCDKALVEIGRGKEFEIEAGFAGQRSWERLR